MKKYLFACLLLALVFNSCSSSNILQKTISYKYYNLAFDPEFLTKKNLENTEITITPIDAKSLNAETYNAAYRDGNYEKDLISSIESWKTKVTSGTRQERILYQGKINALDCLTKLEKDGKIPISISLLLKRKIAYETTGYDGTEIESLTDVDTYTSDYNPYKINANYFSVFRLSFENKGIDVAKINLKEFQLISSEEQLYPLASEYFEENLKGRTETIKNAYRMNMPGELIVTPGQRVTKYIAVPAINAQNSRLQVQFIRSGKVINFDFNVSKKEIEKTYNLERYTLTYKGGGTSSSYRNFFVVAYKNNVSYPLRNDQLFVSGEKKSLTASVYAIGINMSTSGIIFGLDENFTFFGTKKNIKAIGFEKMIKDKKTGTY